LWAKYQVHRFQRCGLAGVVVTDKSSMSIEVDLTVGDASEVPDANTHKMHFDPPCLAETNLLILARHGRCDSTVSLLEGSFGSSRVPRACNRGPLLDGSMSSFSGSERAAAAVFSFLRR